MFPWHLPRYTPAELKEIARRMQVMQDRLDMPVAVRETASGFIARRDGNAGCGRTREEAIQNLYDKENMDTINPPAGGWSLAGGTNS